MNTFTLNEESAGKYLVYFGDLCLGSFVLDADGFFYYWPSISSGCWGAWELKRIADLLDEVNKEWEDKINNDKTI